MFDDAVAWEPLPDILGMRKWLAAAYPLSEAWACEVARLSDFEVLHMYTTAMAGFVAGKR